MATKKRKSSGGVKTKTRTVYRSKKRTYRKKSDSGYIPGAMGTVGIAYANMPAIQTVLNDMSVNGVKSAVKQATTPDQLKKTALFAIGGLVAGEAVKRFAPNIIKKPIGKIARKVPKVL